MKRTAGLTRTTRLESRTPLTRNAGLQPGPWASPVPLLPGNAKSAAAGRGGSGSLTPPAPSEFTPKVRLLVRKRAGRGDVFDAACEACGRHLGEKAGEFQHRAARGAGGCRDEVVNGPANAALLCGSALLRTGCHGACEARDPHLGMDGAGFWIKHGTTPEFDPRNVPILLHSAGGSGLPVFLAADGLGPDGTGYLLSAPEVAA